MENLFGEPYTELPTTCAKCPYKKECDDWPDDISCAEFLEMMKDKPPKEEEI